MIEAKGVQVVGALEEHVAGLDAKLDWLIDRMDRLELGPIQPGRWCWRNAQAGTLSGLWQDLTEWVDWLIPRYGLDELIPPCWLLHGALVEELTSLFAGWHAAYLDPEARGFEPIAWHDALGRALARMRDWNRQGCTVGAHRDDPALGSPQASSLMPPWTTHDDAARHAAGEAAPPRWHEPGEPEREDPR